jgi:hypothetical protein
MLRGRGLPEGVTTPVIHRSDVVVIGDSLSA